MYLCFKYIKEVLVTVEFVCVYVSISLYFVCFKAIF